MATRRTELPGAAAHAQQGPGRQSETTVPLSSELGRAGSRYLVLDVIHPDRRRVHLGRESVVLGRDGPDVLLEGEAVSRRHAEISVRGGVAAIADLGSRNGIHLEGERVTQGRLRNNVLVRIGDHLAVAREVESRDPTPFVEHLPGLWGSDVLATCARLAQTAATTNQAALILGESGTGKELLAQSIHARSTRREASFIGVNCAALSPQLVEAELFGHVKGAFTGAQSGRPGLCRTASGGTLFLDEVGELPPETQAKLLRVIQTREVTPLGTERPVAVDVRYLAATHKNLPQLVDAGLFRLDLYHRLCGLSLRLPPLRERREDILPLFRRFVHSRLGRVPEFGVLLAEALCLHSWPGNVRELEQLASAMASLHGHLERWRLPQLPPEFDPTSRETPAVDVPAAPQPLTTSTLRPSRHEPIPILRPKDLDVHAVVHALTASGGNISQAAKAVGVARETLYALMRKFGIRQETFRQGKSRGGS